MTESRTEYQVKDADKSVTQLMDEEKNLISSKAAIEVRLVEIEHELYTRMFQE